MNALYGKLANTMHSLGFERSIFFYHSNHSDMYGSTIDMLKASILIC